MYIQGPAQSVYTIGRKWDLRDHKIREESNA